jgi:hypothetical protein
MGRLAIVALALALSVSAAHADEQPWVVGVSEEAKTAAKALLAEGNELFLEHKYSDALDRYRKAIARWDHPAIRFNVVRCLIQLDRPVEAAENLDLALKYGPAALEESVYAEAVAYQKLLVTQVGEVELSCEQSGTVVSLDTEQIVTCPGRAVRRVAPGRHIVVGTKQGFQTHTEDIVVAGGKRAQARVALVPLVRTSTVVHRWPTWIPWVVFGGSLAVIGSGILLDGVASARMSDYDRALTRDCAAAGCGPGHPIPAADQALESSAKTYSAIGTAVIVTGAAAAITGGVLLYMNRGQLKDVEVSPTRGGAAISFTTQF